MILFNIIGIFFFLPFSKINKWCMANTFSSCTIFWLIQVVTFQTIPQRRFSTNEQAAALCLGVFGSFPSRRDGLRVLVQTEQMAGLFILSGPSVQLKPACFTPRWVIPSPARNEDRNVCWAWAHPMSVCSWSQTGLFLAGLWGGCSVLEFLINTSLTESLEAAGNHTGGHCPGSASLPCQIPHTIPHVQTLCHTHTHYTLHVISHTHHTKPRVQTLCTHAHTHTHITDTLHITQHTNHTRSHVHCATCAHTAHPTHHTHTHTLRERNVNKESEAHIHTLR